MTLLDLGDVGCTPESHKTVVVGPAIIPINIMYYKRRLSEDDIDEASTEPSDAVRFLLGPTDPELTSHIGSIETHPWALCANVVNLKTGEYAIDAIIVLAESLDHIRLLVRDWAELYVHAAVRMNQIKFDERTDVERISAFKAPTIDASIDTWFDRVLARIRRAS